MMTRRLRVGIIGGGIGGAATATAMLQRGLEVRLFERAPEFSEVGAGIQMTPNAVKVIRAFGLYDRFLKVGFLPEAIVALNWRTGRQHFRTPLKGHFERIYGAPYVQVHRSDLLDVLSADLPEAITSFNKTCIGVDEVNGTPVARFADGEEFEADVIIGADGVRSTVRASLFGNDAPRYTGHMCFRALIPVGGPVDYVRPNNSIWMGPRSHVVTYYVQGGRSVNLVAVAESPKWVEEGWNVPSTRAELQATFPGWHPNVQKLLSNVDHVFRWGLFDRDPMQQWCRGHVTLLGDAAHPMLPFLSQGAAMAIEDAWVLAACLDANRSEPARALQAYEAERRPRTSRVQLESRERGRTYHLPTRFQQAIRNLDYRIRSIVSPRNSGVKADWVYSYDATSFGAAQGGRSDSTPPRHHQPIGHASTQETTS
jgi:salicylate hydroxylase